MWDRAGSVSGKRKTSVESERLAAGPARPGLKPHRSDSPRRLNPNGNCAGGSLGVALAVLSYSPGSASPCLGQGHKRSHSTLPGGILSSLQN